MSVLHRNQIIGAVPYIDLAVVRFDFLGRVAFDFNQSFEQRIVLATERHNHILQ